MGSVQWRRELHMILRLYSDLAHLWPIISPPEEYMVEAQEWLEVIRARVGTGRDSAPGLPTLLELVAGEDTCCRT